MEANNLMKSRPLVLRRTERGKVALHDAETGEVLAAQVEVQLSQAVHDIARVTVTFNAHGSSGLRLEINDD